MISSVNGSNQAFIVGSQAQIKKSYPGAKGSDVKNNISDVDDSFVGFAVNNKVKTCNEMYEFSVKSNNARMQFDEGG